MLEAFEIVSRTLPDARLVIAGGDHPQAHGYVEGMKKKFASPTVKFTGYVEEERLPELFQQSTVAVMPYSSSTGCSGVAHLACAYGVPILCADLPDFRQMGEGEDLAMDFYKPGDAEDLARLLISLLTDPEKQQAMAVHNFTTALRMTMPTIVQKYLRHFELEQRTEAIRQITKFRRLPGWVPSRTLLLRLMTRNSHGWVHRSAVQRPPVIARDLLGDDLLEDDIDAGGKRSGTGVPVNGNGVRSRLGNGVDGSRVRPRTVSPARGDGHAEAENGNHGQHLSVASASTPGKNQSSQAEGQQPEGGDWIPIRHGQTAAGNGLGGNGQRRSGSARSGNNGSGRE
jgi:hypothetical protein